MNLTRRALFSTALTPVVCVPSLFAKPPVLPKRLPQILYKVDTRTSDNYVLGILKSSVNKLRIPINSCITYGDITVFGTMTQAIHIDKRCAYSVELGAEDYVKLLNHKHIPVEPWNFYVSFKVAETRKLRLLPDYIWI